MSSRALIVAVLGLALAAAATPPGALGAGAAACLFTVRNLLHEIIGRGKFETFRGLADYKQFFGPQFETELAALTRKDRWIDVGAGHGRALKELLLQKQSLWRTVRGGKPELIGVAAERPKPTALSLKFDKLLGDRNTDVKMLYGRMIEDIPDAELGRARLVTDVYGALSYADQVDRVLAKELGLLADNGSLYAEVSRAETLVTRLDGQTVDLVDWVAGIDGLEVESSGSSLRVRKKPGPTAIRVPKLRLVSGGEGAPPHRVYVEVPEARGRAPAKVTLL